MLSKVMAAVLVASVAALAPVAFMTTPAGADTHYVTPHMGIVIPNIKLVGVDWDGIYPYPIEMPRDGAGYSMTNFLTDIVSSKFMDGLSEYNTNSGKIGRGTFDGWRKIVPTKTYRTLYTSDILAEVKSRIEADTTGKWTAGLNVTYVVFINGYHDVGDAENCSFHNAGSAKGSTFKVIVIKYLPNRPGCHSSDIAGDLEYSLSHEIAETVTDGVPGFDWYEDGTGLEIADLCSNHGLLAVGTRSYWVANWWSNRYQDCRAFSAK